MNHKTSATLITAAALLPMAFSANAEKTFFENLSELCGTSFVGEMTYPVDGQDSFKGKKLVAEFASCTDNKISIPFHVGEDHSRTWHISNIDGRVSLKHEHRHHDGTLDEVTNYGGTMSDEGNALRQSFPADTYTKELIPEASTNVWAISLSADKSKLTYHLERHQKPRFTAVLVRTANN